VWGGVQGAVVVADGVVRRRSVVVAWGLTLKVVALVVNVVGRVVGRCWSTLLLCNKH